MFVHGSEETLIFYLLEMIVNGMIVSLFKITLKGPTNFGDNLSL